MFEAQLVKLYRSNYWRAIFFFTIILFLALSISACASAQSATQSASNENLSQAVLEEKYGIRVNLIAVTAAGGLIDVRLKLVDPDKAKQLLKDSNNFPSLYVADKSVSLSVPDETKKQEIQFVKDGGVYVMYPNSGDIVQPGSTVMIAFGSIKTEPLTVK